MIFRKAVQNDIRIIAGIYADIHSTEENGNMVIGWSREIYPTIDTAKSAFNRGDLFVSEDDSGTVTGSAIINRIQAEGYEKGNW